VNKLRHGQVSTTAYKRKVPAQSAAVPKKPQRDTGSAAAYFACNGLEGGVLEREGKAEIVGSGGCVIERWRLDLRKPVYPARFGERMKAEDPRRNVIFLEV